MRERNQQVKGRHIQILINLLQVYIWHWELVAAAGKINILLTTTTTTTTTNNNKLTVESGGGRSGGRSAGSSGMSE